MNAFRTTPRKRLTDQQKAKRFLELDGRCHGCNRKLRPGDDYIWEHENALLNGGTNDLDNFVLTCSACKPGKDAKDHAQAAKVRRIATKHVTPGRVRKGPPMPGSRDSKWKKRMNGTVERRI